MNIISQYNSPIFLEKLNKEHLYKEGEMLSVAAGPYLPTQAELAWLKSFLQSDIATTLLSDRTRTKLEDLLKESPSFKWQPYLTKKQMPQPDSHSIHFLALLKQAIRENKGIHITYRTKAGDLLSDIGCPIEFVYNIAKKRAYIKWLHEHGPVITTPLDLLESVETIELENSQLLEKADSYRWNRAKLKKAVVEWKPQLENMDIHRFLHAFSAFKTFLQNDDPIKMEIFYHQEEEHFLLSKIRQFGPHVFIQSPASLQHAMLETARRAMENYDE